MTATRKRWVGILLGVVVLVALLVGLAGREQLPEVMAARATRETLDAWISSNGKVEPVQPYAFRSQLDTFVQRVLATEGQAVKRGQLLLELDATDARAQLAQARVRLAAAQEELRNARAGGSPDQLAQLQSDLSKTQADLTRLRQQHAALERLLASQAATPDELAQNQLALDRAEAEWQLLQKKKEEMARRAQLEISQASLKVHQAQDEVRSLEQKVQSAEVIAPIGGTLYSLPVRPRDYVHVGDLLAEMADLRQARVRAFVDEPDLGWLEPNEAVQISWDAMPTRSWYGRTEQIPKQVVSRGTRSVGEVLCSVDNDKLELLPNINVDVRIRVRQKTGALVVPRAAVRGEGTERYVFLVKDNRLQRHPIQVGIASATRYEVLQGLSEGDEVALPGEVELRDGLEVHPVVQK